MIYTELWFDSLLPSPRSDLHLESSVSPELQRERERDSMSGNKVDTRKKSPLGVDVPDSIPIDTQAVTDFVTRYDEAAKRRLDNMNQKLMDLERQMEALETEMKKAHDSSFFDSFDDYFSAGAEMFQFPSSFPS